jgi:hypothetical protein
MQFDAAAVSTFCARVDSFVERSRSQLQAANSLADEIKLNGAAVRFVCACFFSHSFRAIFSRIAR